MSARTQFFTEHERHLTDHLPEMVAIGYVNARRRDGRGEKAGRRIIVSAPDERGLHHFTETPGPGSLDGYNLGDLFGGAFGGSR